jgi:hypothetical protein
MGFEDKDTEKINPGAASRRMDRWMVPVYGVRSFRVFGHGSSAV